jgi:hypothetical protein
MGARSSAIQLGRTWTLLIVAQVAFTVAVLPAAVFVVWDGSRHAVAEPGFASAEFLTAQLGMDGDTPAIAPAEADRRDLASRLRTRHAELMTSLETQPDVSGATFAFAVPASEPTVRIEIDGLPAPAESPSGHAARPNAVDVGFFDVLDVATLAGRRLHSGDLGAPVIVVNRTFAQRILRGGNALGRRIRYTAGYRSGGVMRVPPGAALERWYEIVGVVDDLPAHPLWSAETEARSYHPLAPGQISPATLIVRWHRGAAASVAGRLREIAAALDPTLRLNAIRFLDEIYRQERLARLVPVMGLGLVTLCVLLLSSAGIYALMSFTVTRRRREIGIRTALGANPRRILSDIFSRAFAQLAIGAIVGGRRRGAGTCAGGAHRRTAHGLGADRSAACRVGAHRRGRAARGRRPGAPGAAHPADGGLESRVNGRRRA